MRRCEMHDAMGNQCERGSVLIVMTVTGDDTRLWGACACTQHAWEATARCAQRVQRARAENDHDARIVATTDDLGDELLENLRRGMTIGDRWPLAQPWAPS